MCEQCEAKLAELADRAGGFGIEIVVVERTTRGRGTDDEGFDRARAKARKQSTTLTLDGEQWAMLRSLAEREERRQPDPKLREIAASAAKVLADNRPPEPDDDDDDASEPAGDKAPVG